MSFIYMSKFLEELVIHPFLADVHTCSESRGLTLTHSLVIASPRISAIRNIEKKPKLKNSDAIMHEYLCPIRYSTKKTTIENTI